MKLVKTVNLDCEGFDYFLKKSNIKEVTNTKNLVNCNIYNVITNDGRKLEIHESAKMYDNDAYSTKLEIYSK